MKEKVQQLARLVLPSVIQFRRHLHQHPELSFQEYETTNYIEQKLHQLGIETTRKYADTGLVAFIKGKNPNQKCIALRADIDALPIQETNEVDYKSVNQGVMHACGHDVHSASLFGAMQILDQLKHQFEGTVKCIFQAGEELLPGGAKILIENNVLKTPNVDAIFGQHVFPELQSGKVGFRSGLYMASTDELHIHVKGKGGHAALAKELKDPIIAMTHLLIQARQAIDTIKEEGIPYVIGFGDVQANGATNVIPNEVKIKGTFRTMNEVWRTKAHSALQDVTRNIEQKFGVTIYFDIRKGYPFLKNDENLTNQASHHAIEYLGENNVVELPLRMTGEDFAYYTHHTKGCFYRLGTSTVTNYQSSVHTSSFDIDEHALEVGAGLMAYLALKELA